MIAIVGDVLAQATPAAKGATEAAELPAAGFSFPLVVLTAVGLLAIVFGATKFFQAFKKF